LLPRGRPPPWLARPPLAICGPCDATVQQPPLAICGYIALAVLFGKIGGENFKSAVASTASATQQERSAKFLAISLELKKAKKPMTGAQQQKVGQSEGGTARRGKTFGPNKRYNNWRGFTASSTIGQSFSPPSRSIRNQ
jgi:hypothetical protein